MSYLNLQAACAKIHENAGRFSDAEIHSVQDRADVIAYSTMAEMQHFNEHRVHDYKQYMQQYLRSQIDFYKQVSNNMYLFKSRNAFRSVNTWTSAFLFQLATEWPYFITVEICG